MRRTLRPIALSVVLFISASAGFGQSNQNAPVEIEGWDISALDTKIAELAPKANAVSASRQDKLAAAAAYFERANFFYNAGRPPLYKLAVGDFRRVIRLQPENREAQEKLGNIVSVYESLGRPVPENGNEQDIYNDPRVRYKVKPEAIKLSLDENTVTLSESLPPNIAYVYQFGGSSGQQMFIKLSVDNAAASFRVFKGNVVNASQIISEVTEWSGMIPEDDTYLIKIMPKGSGVSYKLMVTAERKRP